MQEVYLCGMDVDDRGMTVPRICCPTEALGSVNPENLESVTTTTTTTTTTTAAPTTEPEPWYRLHPGFRHLASFETCGRTFVNVRTKYYLFKILRPLFQRRIVNGKTAELGQYPWLVNIGYSVKWEMIGGRHLTLCLGGGRGFSGVQVRGLPDWA